MKWVQDSVRSEITLGHVRYHDMRGITQDYQLAGFRYPPVEGFACKHWPLEGAINHFQYLCDSRISSGYSNLW
jgi:hypothetical protein